MSQPLVSVVIQTHNRPDWLSEAVQSVVDGEFRDVEILVSNNGNPADTRALAQVHTDPRITWVEQSQDLDMFGHAVAALALARGKYVAVLHDDDRWAPNFLSSLVPAMEASDDVVLAFADHHCIRTDGSIDHEETVRNSHRWGRDQLSKGLHQPFFDIVAMQSVPHTGAVFRRDALRVEDITVEIDAFYDIWLPYLLATTGKATYYHPEHLLYKRVHETNANNKRRISAKLGAVHGRRAMLRDKRMRPYRHLVEMQLARSHVSAALALLGERRHKAAASQILRTGPCLASALAHRTASILAHRAAESTQRAAA